jgi:hypothetical protein
VAATEQATTTVATPEGSVPIATTPAPTLSTSASIQPVVVLPAEQNDPRFDSCKEAKKAGYGPYVRGRDPEYVWYDDRDNDGNVCE